MPACLHRCSHPVLPCGEGSVRPATAANDRDGLEHRVDGRARLAGSRFFHPEPQAEDHRGADINAQGSSSLVMGNGWRASMARTADASIAKSTRRWTLPPVIFARWSSPPATRATAPFCPIFWTRSTPMSRSAPGAATPRPSIAAARRSRPKPDRSEDAPAGSLEPVALTGSTSKPSANASHHEIPTAESHIRIALMNRFNALGTDEIERLA